MPALVWVRTIDMPFRVVDSAEGVLERARNMAEELDAAGLPFLELALDRGSGATVHVNPWAIEAVEEVAEL